MAQRFPAIPRTDKNIALLTKSLNDYGYTKKSGVDETFVGKCFDNLQAGNPAENIIEMFLETQLKNAQGSA